MTTPSTPAHTLDVDVVADFLQALQRSDLDAALALVAEDLIYINVSLPTIHGRRGLDRVFRPLFKPGRAGFAVRMHHIATDGEVVLTDRTDEITLGRFRARFGSTDGSWSAMARSRSGATVSTGSTCRSRSCAA